MTKIKLLLVCLVMANVSFAQQTPLLPDSTAKRDTSNLEDLKEAVLENIPTVSLDDNDLGDGSNQNVSSILTAGRDPYFSAVSFNFSAVRFRLRGYENDLFSTYMNGIPMDNLDNGFTPFGLWGGLNDVTRNKDVSYGLRTNTFAFGDIGSNTSIDSRASKQRRQTSFSYANSNRNYTHRWIFTHSTGMSKKGWAFSFSGSRRWADEGYVPGTYYDGWSFFAAVDKRISKKSLLSLVVFGAPTESGGQRPAVQELQNLSNDPYYNPNWGYQVGKKRNASVTKTNQPVFIFTHDIRVNNNTNITTALGYSFGKRSITAIDWYNAPDPRPDYYRYLPSYYNLPGSEDPYQYRLLDSVLKNDVNARQINWARLYDANRNNMATVQNADGITGNTVRGKRSLYILENRVIDTKKANFNSVINTRFGNHVDFTGGVSFQNQNNRYYKEVADLLGGDFYVNVNQFAERDFPSDVQASQNDVDHPNRILRVGDPFGYDYSMDITKVAAWSQAVIKFNKVDFFVSGEFSNTLFYRVGNVRTGLFPNNSLGKGQENNFDNYGVKAGATYKINGRNYIYVSAYQGTKAPFFENVYISARTRNNRQDNISSEKIQSFEGGYVMNAPKLKVHLSGYYTKFENQMDVMTFYHDGYQNFVNYALSGINKLHFGGELGIEAKVTPTWTVNAAAAIGRYYYDSRPTAVVTVDNNQAVIATQTIYQENFRVPSTPMEAFTLGATYRSPKFWFVSITGNYFDQSWLSINPIRRTFQATDGVEYQGEQWHSIIDQTKFDAQYTIDFFGGYSYKLPKRYNVANRSTYLVLNVGVNNLTNNQKITTGGFEQLRFDDDNKNIDKFPPRVYYAYGLNYFASITYRF